MDGSEREDRSGSPGEILSSAERRLLAPVKGSEPDSTREGSEAAERSSALDAATRKATAIFLSAAADLAADRLKVRFPVRLEFAVGAVWACSRATFRRSLPRRGQTLEVSSPPLGGNVDLHVSGEVLAALKSPVARNAAVGEAIASCYLGALEDVLLRRAEEAGGEGRATEPYGDSADTHPPYLAASLLFRGGALEGELALGLPLEAIRKQIWKRALELVLRASDREASRAPLSLEEQGLAAELAAIPVRIEWRIEGARYPLKRLLLLKPGDTLACTLDGGIPPLAICGIEIPNLSEPHPEDATVAPPPSD